MILALDAHDRLLHQGISHPTIYIIAPYNRQVDLLEELLKERRSKRAITLEKELARYGLDPRDLGNKDQVQHLLTQRRMNGDCVGRLQALKYQLELKAILVLTIDKAQGSEADVVVLSTVKCGNFTQDPRRMCVALSRARHQSILVGNSGEMEQHPMWARIIRAYKQGA
ncbi:AAA domain-containing protein [Dunaliella salina]|uniref:AAA domain-containing protein n=1 Tax=Dunaliella salina TaxID=3046 RepID=A0ABQ7H5Y1_DUNSA|nr:AAA domain-containing protein [Dunaliella salina]|eukprot:KAF5842248.1 AAA domain-containing protein [Dunaliella salina]